MRILKSTLAIALLGLLASPVFAEEEKPRERPPRDDQFRQKLLERFDKDGDGKLSEDEKKAAKEARAKGGPRGEARRGDRPLDGERRGEAGRGKGRGPEGRGGEARRGKGRGGPGGPPHGEAKRGPGRPDGPPGGRPPMFDPELIFDRIDANGDGEISREEFKEGMKKMRPPGPPAGFGERGRGGPDGPRFRGGPGGPVGPRVGRGGPGGPDGPRFGRRGPEGGPPREGRRPPRSEREDDDKEENDEQDDDKDDDQA